MSVQSLIGPKEVIAVGVRLYFCEAFCPARGCGTAFDLAGNRRAEVTKRRQESPDTSHISSEYRPGTTL
jgi:hypothetical protein